MNYRDVLGYVALFGLVSMISLIFVVGIWGVNNDYVIWELSEYSQTALENGMISQGIRDGIDSTAEAHMGFSVYLDNYWVLSYILFIGASIGISYFSKDEDEFSFLGMLFYGTMIILFIFSIGSYLTDWLGLNVLYSILPNLENVLPKYSYWRENAGLFTFIHLLFCIVANKIDLKIGDSFKKKGAEFVDTNEVL